VDLEKALSKAQTTEANIPNATPVEGEENLLDQFRKEFQIEIKAK